MDETEHMASKLQKKEFDQKKMNQKKSMDMLHILEKQKRSNSDVMMYRIVSLFYLRLYFYVIMAARMTAVGIATVVVFSLPSHRLR